MAEATHEEFLRLYKPLHQQFVRYCSNHAYGLMETEDLVQETILSTLQRFDSIREKEKLIGYMITAANNIVRNHLRRKKFKGDFNEKAFRRLEAGGTDAETALDIHHLHVALQQLPVKDKEAILLFEINGFSIEEIAAIQGATAGATKTRLSRAREKLRVLMEDEVPQPEPAGKVSQLFMLL